MRFIKIYGIMTFVMSVALGAAAQTFEYWEAQYKNKGITVTSPSAGQTLTEGDEITIRFDTSESVEIVSYILICELTNGIALSHSVSDSIHNSGNSFEWTVYVPPIGLPPITDRFSIVILGVTSLGETSSGMSDIFYINDGSPALTFGIHDAWWISADEVDVDGDGYAEERHLAWNADVTSGSTSPQSVYAKIYSRLDGASTWSLYDTTLAYTITGDSSVDGFGIMIRSGSEDVQGFYDFKIELFQEGYSTVVASLTYADDSDLDNVKFEPPPPLTFGIQDAWWISADEVDVDGDGYAEERHLAWNADVTSGSTSPQSVYAKIYSRLDGASTWSLYDTTLAYTITGDSSVDGFGIMIRSGSEDVQGFYDFKIELFQEGYSTVVASLTYADDSDLDNVKFEPPPPLTFGIQDAWWISADEVDVDGDGYAEQRRLAWDADVISGSTSPQSVYAKIYYRLDGASTWSLDYTTAAYTITGYSSDDWYSILIGINPEYPHGSYDFKIELFREGSSTVVASLTYAADSDLNNVKLEPPPLTFGIYDAWWISDDEVDVDGDGYAEQRRLAWDADVISGSTSPQSVYAKIYYRLDGASTWSLDYTTAAYTITGYSSDDWYSILIGINPEYPHGSYDFKIELFREGSSTVVASLTYAADSDLNNVKLEPLPLYLSIRSVPPGVEISWPSLIDKIYQVQYSTNLVSTHWYDLGATVLGNGTTNFLLDVNSDPPMRFYRVLKE